ncbi:MAG: beta-N-acetylhexosaminidase [Myxococcota bacterium]
MVNYIERALKHVLWIVLAACVRSVPPSAPPPPAPTPTAPAVKVAPPPLPLAPVAPTGPDVEALLAQMSLSQKVGQLMMVGFAGTAVDEDIEALVKDRQVGGVCMFKRNIVNAAQIARLNDEVRALLADSVPPFIAVDQEGGNVVRIADGNVVLPGNMALGATRSAQLAYQAGKAQGEDLRRLGFNMNLAPVLDVNLNPKNPVIGIRSFGDEVELVARFGADFVRGQQDANMVTVAKHFPGHGSTEADSHKALPVMKETESEMLLQMEPFRVAVEAGLDGLMTAHVAMPKVTGDDLPATLSRQVLTHLLRQRLGFGGLVLTDELEMEAIANRYGVGRAAVMAIQAGADMVLIPWRPEKKTEVYLALLEAARSGALSAQRLDETVRRILTVKVKRGLFEPPPPLAERLARLGSDGKVAEQIAQAAVTLLRWDGRVLPLRASQKIVVATAEGALARAISARAPLAQALVVPAYASSAERARARQRTRELAASADVVVVGVINSRQLELVTLAASTGKPVVAVTMGLPYLGEQVSEAQAVLATYSYREVSAAAAAAALFGEIGTPGKLPVRLSRYPFGHGVELAGPTP